MNWGNAPQTEPDPEPEPARSRGFFPSLIKFAGDFTGWLLCVAALFAILFFVRASGSVLGTGSMEPTLSGGDVVWENPLADSYQRVT